METQTVLLETESAIYRVTSIHRFEYAKKKKKAKQKQKKQHDAASVLVSILSDEEEEQPQVNALEDVPLKSISDGEWISDDQ